MMTENFGRSLGHTFLHIAICKTYSSINVFYMTKAVSIAVPYQHSIISLYSSLEQPGGGGNLYPVHNNSITCKLNSHMYSLMNRCTYMDSSTNLTSLYSFKWLVSQTPDFI